VVVLGVHTAFEEFEEQPDDAVKKYVESRKFGYPVGIAKSAEKKAPRAMDDYRTGGTPCAVVIDRKGVVRFKKLGLFDQGEMKKLLDELLAEEEKK
jgi:hypothetical protein